MSNARVLVAEDDLLVRRTLCALLRRSGCEVFEAGDGREAIAVAGNLDALDAVVTDLQMPHHDGFEVIRRIRPRFPAVPVLVVSGTCPEMTSDEASLADGFLQKPYSFDEVRSFVERASRGSTRPDPGNDESRLDDDVDLAVQAGGTASGN